MIRISATLLEQFRRHLAYEYVPEQDIIDSVMGKPIKPTWQMEAGTAWGQALAGGPSRVGSYNFDTEAVRHAQGMIGPGLWEVKATRTLDSFGVLVTLVAQVDHVNGAVIQENKARFGTIDAKDWEQSIQWPVYLWVHHGRKLVYNAFAFRNPTEAGYCELREVQRFPFYAYSTLEEDLQRAVNEFLDWCHLRKLTNYLHRESREGAA